MITVADLLQNRVTLSPGRPTGATEQYYRQFLQFDPENADAWHLLGVVAMAAATVTRPWNTSRQGHRSEQGTRPAKYHFNLGRVYRSLGRSFEALSATSDVWF